MADFTTLTFDYNRGTAAAPTWETGSGSGKKLRWAASSGVNLATSTANWPSVASITKPASGAAGVDFAYVFSADTTGHGLLGGGSGLPPAPFATSQFRWGRVAWDNLGSFASAPILTAYPTTAHGAITRGDGSLLGGHASDTGATPRSYLKAAAWGRVSSAGAPAAGPGSTPLVTDGTTGAVTPTAGANWSAWQGLMGSLDWIAFPSTPAATTANQWEFLLRLFVGANLTGGTVTCVLTISYTFS